MLSPIDFDMPLNVEHTLVEVKGLISLPEIYQKIRQLMDDPKSDIQQFVMVVASDPNLTATVLKIANSAFFGFPGKIDSINRAINMLGIGQLHDLVLATSAIHSLDLPNEIMPLKTFWRFSLFSAILAGLMAKQLKIAHGERLFVIGLLHEIGHLIIYAKYPLQAKLALDMAEMEHQMLHVAEQKLLGLHYGEIGAKLMALWRLPGHFQNIVQYQPTPDLAREYIMETLLLHVVHGFAQKLILNSDKPIETLVAPQAWATLNLVPAQLDSTLEAALQACLDMEKIMFS